MAADTEMHSWTLGINGIFVNWSADLRSRVKRRPLLLGYRKSGPSAALASPGDLHGDCRALTPADLCVKFAVTSSLEPVQAAPSLLPRLYASSRPGRSQHTESITTYNGVMLEDIPDPE